MAENINIREKAKMLWIRSMKTIGNTAANIANNTKFKVDEMTLQNRRRELTVDLSDTVYALWMKGTKFPPELTKLLEELQQLDDRLNDMRAEKYAQGKSDMNPDIKDEETESNDQPEDSAEKGEPEDESPEEDTELSEAITGASSYVKSGIDGCFDHETSVDKMAEKVNTSLDQLTDKIRRFSPEVQEDETNQANGG